MGGGFDYEGVAILLASCTSSIVALVTLVRQGRADAATKKRDEVLHDLVNGQSEKINVAIAGKAFAEGSIAGAKDERDRSSPAPG